MDPARIEAAKNDYHETLDQHIIAETTGKRVMEMKEGERPSRYFCNLLKNAVSQKYIPKLIDDNGT